MTSLCRHTHTQACIQTNVSVHAPPRTRREYCSLFQVQRTTCEHARRRPLDFFFIMGTLKVRLSAAERKDLDGWYSSSKPDMYGGAVPKTPLWQIDETLYSILWAMGSQWSLAQSNGVTEVRLVDLNMRRAEQFLTLWSLSSRHWGSLVKGEVQ